MKKNYRSSLILLGCLAGLIAWYFIYEKRVRVEHTKAEEKEAQLLGWDPKDVQIFEISKFVGKDKEPRVFKFKRTGDDWTVTHPIDYPADTSVVNTLVSTLVAAKQDRVVDESPKDLATYGLATPYLTLTLSKDSQTKPSVILVGDTTPVGSNIYVKMGDKDVVYRTAQTLRTMPDKDLSGFRSKEILKLTRSDIEEAEIQTARETILIKRQDKDSWVLPRQNLPVDNTEWNKSLNALVDLKAKEFASETGNNLATFGLAQPQVRISLVVGTDKKKVLVLLGKVKDKYYAKLGDKPTVFEITKDAEEKLSRPESVYRSLKLATFNRFDIKKIKIERDKDSLELQKTEGKWTIPAEPTAAIETAKVDSLLSALQDTKIERYDAAKAQSNSKATLVVRLLDEKDKKEEERVVLKFFGKTGKSVKGSREGLSQMFWIKSDDYKKMDLSKKDLSKKDFLQPPKPEKTEEKKPEKKS